MYSILKKSIYFGENLEIYLTLKYDLKKSVSQTIVPIVPINHKQ